MKKIDKVLSMLIVASISTTTAVSSLALASKGKRDTSTKSEQASRQLQKALDDSNQLMLQFLIAASLAESKGADLAIVDEDVISKYNSLRNTYFGSVPVSFVGGGFVGYFGPQTLKLSAEAAGPLLEIIQPALQALQKSAIYSSEKIEDFIVFMRLDVALEKSSTLARKSSTKVWEGSLKPVLGSLVTKGAKTLSGFLASGSLLYGSFFFITNDAQEAMVNPAVRTLLGQDAVVRNRIKSLVNNVAGLINLNESSKAKLEVAIYDSIIKQAVANDFSQDASKYSLDILQILESNNLIDASLSASIKKISVLAETIDLESSGSAETLEIISQNIDLTLALASALQSNLNEDKIKDLKTKAELQRMLGALDAQLALLGFNIKK